MTAVAIAVVRETGLPQALLVLPEFGQRAPQPPRMPCVCLLIHLPYSELRRGCSMSVSPELNAVPAM